MRLLPAHTLTGYWVFVLGASFLPRSAGQHISPTPLDTGGPQKAAEPLLKWPFAVDVNAQVYQTYGQSERISPTDVHKGLDLAVASGTAVFSPVDGEVAMYFDEGYPVHKKGLGIRTSYKGKNVLVKLLHMELSSLQFGLGDQVKAGELLGTVHSWESNEYHPHLHIEIGFGSLSPDISMTDKKTGNIYLVPSNTITTNVNPLLHLAIKPDTYLPRCVYLTNDGPFVFRPLSLGSDGKLDRSKETLHPRQLTGLIDIEFAIADRYASAESPVIAPLEVVLEIKRHGDHGEVVLRQSLSFRGELWTSSSFPRSIYLCPSESMRSSHSAFVFHLMGLNGVGGRGQGLSAWNPSAGEYVVTLLARDQGSDLHVLESQNVIAK